MLYDGELLTKKELTELLSNINEDSSNYLFERSRKVSLASFGNKIYIRGLIEFTNYCKNNCYYCGIRAGNEHAVRYRLSKDDILDCCRAGYDSGFRTFVLQGGEDSYFDDDIIIDILASIKALYGDCAVTLSIGEKNRASYQKFFDAGADRYLLRHETADEEHYRRLHPKNLSLKNRLCCLNDLKEIGFQVGAGFMVGSPFQTIDNIVDDILFLRAFKPHMIGIGPFIPHNETPFAGYKTGSVDLTLFLIGILRLMLPKTLSPATTALGTAVKNGRIRGILAGANVVMPNLSPLTNRKNYALYNGKIFTGEEAAETLHLLRKQLKEIGYETSDERGDYKD